MSLGSRRRGGKASISSIDIGVFCQYRLVCVAAYTGRSLSLWCVSEVVQGHASD